MKYELQKTLEASPPQNLGFLRFISGDRRPRGTRMAVGFSCEFEGRGGERKGRGFSCLSAHTGQWALGNGKDKEQRNFFFKKDQSTCNSCNLRLTITRAICCTPAPEFGFQKIRVMDPNQSLEYINHPIRD